ncbi:MAG: prenyltransferase/squalene oxidase repeat-containing protein [Anaerolineales bacterium]|jgi:squalene cyclase
MKAWRAKLTADPIPGLLAAKSESLRYYARRDLLGEAVPPVRSLWALPEAERILRRQNADGSWEYPGGKLHIRSREDYNQLETFRRLGQIVEMFAFDRRSSAVEGAATFLLRHQSQEGTFAGSWGASTPPTTRPACSNSW